MSKIAIVEFEKMLKGDKAVTFELVKKDSTSRVAVGTLNESLMPAASLPKNPKVTKNVNFFDLDKKSWRSLPSDVKEVNVID